MKKFQFLFFVCCAATIMAQEVHRDYVDGMVYARVTGEVTKSLLTANSRSIESADIESLEPLVAKFGISRVVRPFAAASDDGILPHIIRIHFSQAGLVDQLITELYELEQIVYAEKIPLARTTATPNDYALSSASLHLNQINATGAWNYFSGNSNITVAIVDNAVMWTHTDLVGNVYTNAGETPNNGIDDDNNGYIDDVNGFDVADWDNDPLPPNVNMSHGTMCAGIAAARTDNNNGVASIGWNVKMIPVKAQPDMGSVSTVLYGYEGIVYAARAKAKIISCSWGSSLSSKTEQAVVNYAWNRGSIVIASAGNSNGPFINYPGSYNNVYSVAGVDQNDVKSNLSSYGPWVDIAAPGDNIYTTLPYTGSPNYGGGTGTSMAAPMVAGLAALIWSKSPAMTKQDVLNCISSTAVNISTISANSSYTLGAGRIDALAAMQCAASYSAIPPVAQFSAFMRNTCPNTPVQFTDSSLYLPTAWSWTFQGGNPATSTQANPVIQYSLPGTYSVALAASNAYGTDTEARVGYITVSGPISPPLVEGFEQPVFLPQGWTAKNIMNDSMYWVRRSNLGAFGTSTACAIFDNFTYSAEGERDEMLTPKYTFTNVVSAQLHFDVAYARYDQDYSDTLQVLISTNCGASWTSIYVKGGSQLATAPDQSPMFVPSSTQWRTDLIDITGLTAGQSNVMFSFVNRGHYGQPIYLDNINIVFPTPTVNVAVPPDVCEGAMVSFTNSTAGAGAFGWTIPGGSPAVTTASAPAVTFTSAGSQQVVLVSANGSSSVVSVYTIQVHPMPTLAVTAPTLICSGTSVTLSATGASSYSWSSGSTLSAITETPMVTTNYTVTGTNGGVCSQSSIINVSVNPTPTLLLSQPLICAGSTATLSAAGAMSYTWHGLGNAATVTVAPAATTVYTVTGSNHNCHTVASATVTVSNAVVTAVATTTPPSCASCANGAVIVVPSGGTAPYTYHWSNGAGGPAIQNLAEGCYTVIITEQGGCQTQLVTCISTVTAMKELERSLSIFPNPVEKILTIETAGGFYYVISNSLGQTVTSGHGNSSVTVDVSGFAKGAYQLVLKNANGLIRRKLLIQ